MTPYEWLMVPVAWDPGRVSQTSQGKQWGLNDK
jgi:hypothetical protein